MHLSVILGASLIVGSSFIASESASQNAASSAEALSSSGESAANYIEGAQWTYPSLADIFANTRFAAAEVIVDCAILPTGHLANCSVISQGKPADIETRKAIGVAYLRHAVVDPKTIDGGIQPGDRVRFHYDWHNLPASDLADASRFPRFDDADGTRYVHSVWTYPPANKAAQYYPERASSERVGDSVVLYCEIKTDGSLTACQVINDQHPEYGFGLNTAEMFEKYCHVAPASVDGGIKKGDYKLFTYIWAMG